MIITFLRSSSVSTYEWCPHKYLIEYVLGYKGPANKKADMGNVVHKVLELRALWKKAIQDGESKVISDDFGWLTFDQIEDTKYVSTLAYQHYMPNDGLSELDTCIKWCEKVIGTAYDPMNMNLVLPEKFFEIPFPDEWASYSYRLPNGELLEGQLELKGTIDLVVAIDDATVELIDWKTGRQYDWNKGTEKGYADLLKDFQIQLYYYCGSLLFPGKNLIFTIHYINGDGPMSMTFDQSQVAGIKERLRETFQTIKKDLRPKLNESWKCSKLCHCYKVQGEGGLNLCQSVRKDIYDIGLNPAIDKWTTDKSYSNLKEYGAGGGRKATV